MHRNFRVARACGVEAARDFQWREYAPLAWILGVQLLFLILALNVGTLFGMATVGAVMRLISGDAPLHYPTFFLYLPNAASWLELVLYTVAGAFLIPLAIARIQAPMDPELEGAGLKARLKQAWPPTLVSLILMALLLWAWQWIFNQALVPLIRASLPQIQSAALIWGVSMLGSYSLSALFLYVPVVALHPGSTFMRSLNEGIREGLRLFKWTILYVLIFALPAMPFLMVMQLGMSFIAERMRPEMVVILIGLYATLISLATYLTYAAAARLHWASQMEDA